MQARLSAGHPLLRGSPQGQLAPEDGGYSCQLLTPPSASRNPGPLGMPGPAGIIALAQGLVGGHRRVWS